MPDSRLRVSEPTPAALGFIGERWVETGKMSISVFDTGFRQAVTAVERLRTYHGKVFQLEAHLRRWKQTIDQLGIDGLPPEQLIAERIDELLQRNRAVLDAWQETGITMFATPGVIVTSAPTFAMHLNQLDLDRITRRRCAGQPLIVTGIRQPPPETWPRGIKVRCRLHYYLADQFARDHDPDALGVLIDEDQTITETSIANIATIEGGEIVSPPVDRVLAGITQAVVERIAGSQGLQWRRDSISVDRMQSADEVLLMGTDTGIWFASQVNGHMINGGQPGPIYQQLRDGFDALTLPGRDHAK